MCADSAKKNGSLCSPAFFAKIVLTKPDKNDILVKRSILSHAGVAQLVEQLICNQQVGGSNPSTSSTLRRSAEPDKLPHLFLIKVNMEEFPSGQRGQTVNLLRFGGSNQPSSTEKTAWLLRPCRFCYVPKYPKTG